MPYIMIGYVTHIQDVYKGKMPTKWQQLVLIHFVKRKIASLLMQYGCKMKVMHLVPDTHLCHVFALNKWVPEAMINGGKASVDRMAQYFEKWFLSYKQEKVVIVGNGTRCFTPIGLRSVNEIYESIRQHFLMRPKHIAEQLFQDAAEEVISDMQAAGLQNASFDWQRLKPYNK